MNGARPSGKARKLVRRLQSPFVLTIAVGAAATVAAVIACGTNDAPPPLGDNLGIGPRAAPDNTCTQEGAIKACHMNLGATGGVQQCFFGTQACIGGFWGPCGGGGTVEARRLGTLSILGSKTGGASPPLRIASSVGALTCVDSTACSGQSCSTQGVACGHTDDGCGNDVNCGRCPGGQHCTAGVCGAASCTAVSMATACAGIACGSASDGCNNTFNCGTCPNMETCVSGQCTPACAPTTCAALGIACGHADDGCGGDLTCGGCGGGMTCISGVCTTGSCTALTMAQACSGAGNACGVVSDGCGGSVNCGNCPPAEGCIGAISSSGGDAGADAGASGTLICPNDPCDPYCSEVGSDAGLTLDSGTASTIFVPAEGGQATISFTGVLNQAPLGTTSNGTNNACSGGSNLNIGACLTNADCAQDFHCTGSDGGAGTCVWSVPTNYCDPTCTLANGTPGVDLTIGAPCANGGGFDIPICNRGCGNLPAGTVIALENDGNGGFGAWNCITNPTPPTSGASASCQYTTQKALGPGECEDIDTTTTQGAACAVLETGHRDIYINYDKSVTECGIGFSDAGAASGAGCMNNSTATKATGAGCPATCGGSGGCEQYTYTVDAGPDAGAGTSGPQTFFGCQMDTYCDPSSLDGGTGACLQFPSGSKWPEPEGTTQTGGVDLTIGNGCSLIEGHGFYHIFPVCNRGDTTLTPSMSSTGQIAISSFPWQPPAANLSAPYVPPGPCIPTDNSALCHYNIPTAGIAPGQCVLVDFSGYNTNVDGGDAGYICSGGEPVEPTYNQLLFVNSDYAVAEDNLQPVPALSQTTQPGCANNWGDQWAGAGGNSNNPPACGSTVSGFMPQTDTFTYTASGCASGTHPKWSLLTYSSVIGVSGTSDSAELIFAVATAPLLLDGGVGAFTPFVTVADGKGIDGSGNNLGDPAICALTGPASLTPATACTDGNGNPTPACCPKLIAATLQMPTPSGLGAGPGISASTNEVLQLRITINPSSDLRSTVTVNNWQVSFDCIPGE